jgi:Ice-binding-like
MLNVKLLAMAAGLALLGLRTDANGQLLGTADSFAVLAGSTVTNTGPTVLWGDLGVWPGSSITGFPPGVVHGTIHSSDAVAMQAETDAAAAYNSLLGEAFDQDLTGTDLGGMTLFPGVYHFDSSAFLTGALILDSRGDPNARFDFQIGSTLITASNSSVHFINGDDSENVYWQVGSSATLGSDSAFAGHILAMDSITATTGASILDGSAIALTGAVTLDTNLITAPAAPEPVSILALGAGIAVLMRRRRS